MNRRQFGFGLAGGLGFPGCSQKNPETVTATGTAFGTEVAVTLPASTDAEIFDQAFAEIGRLESLFTLFDPASPLRRLNDWGRLADPPGELLAVLEICEQVHQLTGGAFDPTVQPLWELYEQHYAENPTDPAGPNPEAVAEARSRVDWKAVTFSSSGIRFAKPGMAMTLNGIAPGFAADQVAAGLQDRGVHHALVNTGEFRALGSRPDGSPWPVGIRHGEAIAATAELDGNALATSAGHATAFDLAEQFHHLFHPRDNTFQSARRTIAIEAPQAALADALATAGGVMPTAAVREIAKKLPQVRCHIFGG